MPNVTVHTLVTLTAAIISECEEDADFSDLFVAEIPNFIRRAESRLYGDLNLELFDRVATGTLTAATKVQAIRAMSWQQIRSLHITPAAAAFPRWPILRRSYDFCTEYDADATTTPSGRPPYFSELSETEILVCIPPDQAYQYTAHIVRNDTTQSLIDEDPDPTWLSTNMGDSLLFACLVEAMRWLQASVEEMVPYEGQYQARLTIDKMTLRESMRAGDYTPVADAAKTVADSQ